MKLLAPIRGRLAVCALLAALGAAAQVIPFVAVADLARSLLAAGPTDSSDLWRSARLAVTGFGISGLCVFVAGIVSHLADNDLQLGIHRRLARHLDRVPLGWFSATSSGQVKKAVTDDVTTMHHMVAHAVIEVTSAAVTPIVAIVYLATIDWQLTIVVCIPLVVGVALYGAMMARSGEMYRDYDAAMGRLNAAAVEFVQGIAVVKTFGETGRAHDRFLREALSYIDRFWNMVKGLLRLSATTEVVMSPIVSLAFTLTAGTLFVSQGWLGAVDVVPFALLGLGITAPILALGQSGETMRQALAAAGRVESLLATPELPTAASSTTGPTSWRVQFEAVGFSYDDGGPMVLSDIDLVLEPGTTTALVGASGSGKSTIGRLLARFWDPTSGRILLGGVDLRQLEPADLYRAVGMVFQDVQLLRTTVRRNIAMARPDASDDEVERAAEAAQIHDRIVALPRGYDSIVGVHANFSGGEAQRVSIARALLADAPILALDEATAFADPESEALIQDALSELAAGRTLLVIAHRLHTVAGADQIVVLDGGRIVQRGTHAELVDRPGRYAELWALNERTQGWHLHGEGPGSPVVAGAVGEGSGR